jgi:hypothetical protein
MSEGMEEGITNKRGKSPEGATKRRLLGRRAGSQPQNHSIKAQRKKKGEQ